MLFSTEIVSCLRQGLFFFPLSFSFVHLFILSFFKEGSHSVQVTGLGTYYIAKDDSMCDSTASTFQVLVCRWAPELELFLKQFNSASCPSVWYPVQSQI